MRLCLYVNWIIWKFVHIPLQLYMRLHSGVERKKRICPIIKIYDLNFSTILKTSYCWLNFTICSEKSNHYNLLNAKRQTGTLGTYLSESYLVFSLWGVELCKWEDHGIPATPGRCGLFPEMAVTVLGISICQKAFWQITDSKPLHNHH